ncbi:MAG TPA: HNH endonuclease signature motif containing protein [Thermosynechococcaceae cyanobacterium]
MHLSTWPSLSTHRTYLAAVECHPFDKSQVLTRFQGWGYELNLPVYFINPGFVGWQQVGDRGSCQAVDLFSTKNQVKLAFHTDVLSVRHIKVRSHKSYFDGDVIYWSTRKGTHPELPQRVARLLKKNKGKCAECGLMFTGDDLIEVDHILPKSRGGTDQFDNLQPLHRHCHDVKTACDASSWYISMRNTAWDLPEGLENRQGADDNSRIVEEPCAGKLASTVLKGRVTG